MKKLLENILYIATGVLIAFLILKVLGFTLGTDFPVVSVVSGSMRHDTGNFLSWIDENNKEEEVKNWKFNKGLKEGDMIIVVGATKEDLKIGDVVVYLSPIVKYPIIHRVIDINEDGTYIIKGDNNTRRDQHDVPLEWIQGKAVFAVPGLGLPKYILMGILNTMTKIF